MSDVFIIWQQEQIAAEIAEAATIREEQIQEILRL